MKKALLFTFFTVASLNAQVGVGTTAPNPSALLDVYSTTAGFLMPRLTTIQRTGIPLPAAGLQVYDTNTNSIWFYNGTIWKDTAVSTTTVSNTVTGNSLTTTVNGVTANAVTLPGTTASNGLTNVAGDIRLGGTLTAPTVVSQGSSSMMFYGSGTLYKSGGTINVHTDSDLGNGLSIAAGNSGTYFRAIDSYSPNGSADIYFQSSPTDLASVTTKMMIGVNGNVGIGTITPTAQLHNTGTVRFEGINAAAGRVLTSDALGNATWAAPSGLGTTLPNGQVFVGNASNVATAVAMSGDATMAGNGVLTISNNAVASAEITDNSIVNADLTNGTGGIYKGSGSLSGDTNATQNNYSMTFTGDGKLAKNGGLIEITSEYDLNSGLRIKAGNQGTYFQAMDSYALNGSSDFYFQNSGSSWAAVTTKMMIGANGNVGIGTTAPTAQLHNTGTVRFEGINPAAGRVLTSDALGNATWAAPSGLGTTLPNGQVFVGNASNVATAVAMSGDATMAGNGVLTISNNAVASAEIIDNSIVNADLTNGTGGIYKGSGSLSGDTTVTQNASNLTFSGLGKMTKNGGLIELLSELDPNNGLRVYAGNSGTYFQAMDSYSVNGSSDFYFQSSESSWGTMTTKMIIRANGNVGIGTTAPTAQLHNTGTVRFEGINPAAGRVLTSDTFGNATWSAPSGLGTTLPNGQVFVGNASNVATAVAMSGDATMANNGVLTISNNAVASAEIIDNTITNADLTNGTGGIYKGSGSLSGDTTVTQNASNLTFSGLGKMTKNGGLIELLSELDPNNGLRVYAGNSGTYFQAMDSYSLNGSSDFYFQSSESSWGTMTTKMIIRANGNVGIGTTVPTGRLSFANDLNNKKIVLYDNNGTADQNQFYGFGISGGTLRYHVDGTVSNHIFYAGTGTSTANELMRVQGDGYVGIGTTSPSAKLHVIGSQVGGTIQADNNGNGYGLYSKSVGSHGLVTSSFVANTFGGLGTSPDNATGIAGVSGDGLLGFLPEGSGGAFTGTRYGAYAMARLSGNWGTNRATFRGDYYDNGTFCSVYVGAHLAGTNYKILGTGGGSVSTTMPTRSGEKILFAPEAPENWFFDIGEATLVNGKATVTIDPLFVDCISDSKPFKVFVQDAEGVMGRIHVTRNQNAKTFTLEDTGGASNGTVQYQIYAIWKTKENLRFPEFKAPAKALQREIPREAPGSK